MRRYVVALMAVGSVTLAACGSSSTKTNSDSATTVQSASPSTTAAASSSGSLAAVASTGLGQTLVDSNGMTLYRFDKDSGTTIACTGSCASTWPPLTAPAGSTAPSVAGVTELSLVARPDGSMQLAHQGHPLYRFTGDTKAGDTKGNGFNGIWHTELTSGPAGSASSTSATTQAPAATPTTSGGSSYYP
jgi:predicted lipoprotein with Yx(FWY)xxD motif